MRMCVLNKGAWPNACSCDCSFVPQQKKAHTSWRAWQCNVKIAISTNSKIPELWTSTRVFRYLCCARSKFDYVLIHEMRLTASVLDQYPLISEYALIRDMRLITVYWSNMPVVLIFRWCGKGTEPIALMWLQALPQAMSSLYTLTSVQLLHGYNQ